MISNLAWQVRDFMGQGYIAIYQNKSSLRQQHMSVSQQLKMASAPLQLLIEND